MSRRDREWATVSIAVERAVGPEAMGKACASWAHAYVARRRGVLSGAWYRAPLIRLGSLVVRGRRRQVV